MNIKPTPETIWKRPAYLPYVHAPLTDEVIRQAEHQLGCSLPDDFLNILHVQNGGAIRFRIPDSIGDTIAGIGPSFPSITDFDLMTDQEYVDYSLEGLVPFDGDGHWYYCLDFRDNDKSPTVSYIDVECNSQHLLASSFSSFMNLMELDMDNEMVIMNVRGLEDAQKQFKSLFKSDFEARISNVGVPYLFSQCRDQKNRCYWITGNEVARGYSGHSQQEFRFEGKALLVPELPSNAVFFQAPDDVLNFYRENVRDAGFDLVTVEQFLGR